VPLGGEQSLQQGGVGLILRPGGPERLAEVMLELGVLGIQLRDPGAHGRKHLAGGPAAEFAAGAVAGAVLRQLEIFEQLRDRRTGDPGRFHEGTVHGVMR
jgi:hypothetical protein